MKKIGCFRKEGGEFIGTVVLLQADFKAKIAPIRHKHSSVSPDYIITKIGCDDFTAELGAAWQKYSIEQDMSFLVVTLDNPALQGPINAVLCQSQDDHSLWYLYWDRLSAGQEEMQRLFVQEELKPQLGIRPVANMTPHFQKYYPDLIFA